MDFCLYLWQCQCRDSEMHLKHVIILGNPLRPEMEQLKAGSACWLPSGAQHAAGPCGLQWWDQHRAHTDWQEPGCAEQLRNCHSCWMEQNMIFKLALCSISLWSWCLFSFACKIHARLWQERKGKVLVTGCDCRTLSDGHSFYSL